jgi:hypothetical protein
LYDKNSRLFWGWLFVFGGSMTFGGCHPGRRRRDESRLYIDGFQAFAIYLLEK